MELLVMTLAYTTPARDSDALARVRLMSETIHNAPGMMTAQCYRGRGTELCYAVLTTWENEEAWGRARTRYNPRQLLASAGDTFVSTPEQWYLSYLWGYHRPSAQPVVATMQIATISQDNVDVAQRGWIEGLRRQAAYARLAFAFLARGISDTVTTSQVANPTNTPSFHTTTQQGKLFLNLLSWASEGDRETFFDDPDYKAIRRFLRNIGTLHTLALEPM